MAWYAMNMNYILETLKTVAKDVLKEFTTIGTNKTAGTSMSAF